MRIQLKMSRREDDGAVAVMVAIFAVMLIGVAAFTTDFGMAFAQRRALSTGADSGALAVIRAQYLAQTATPTRTCASALTQDAALASGNSKKASTIALAQINANAPFNATIAAADVTTTLSCVSAGTVLQVDVAINRTMNRILGGVLGSNSTIQLGTQAKAALGVVNGVSDLAPMTICTNQATAIINRHLADVAASKPDSNQLVPLDKVWGSGASCDGGGGSGNWGWLDFGSGVSVPDLVSYINGSYKTTITLDASGSYWMDGTPGNKGNAGPVSTAMDGLMDENVNLPVYSSVTGNGANTKYKIVGFLSVKLCGYQANNKNEKGTCYDSVTPGVQLTGDDMQIIFAGFTPLGQIGEVCAIGSPCATTSYITKLLA